jgi:hypothetical protein
VTDAFRTLGLTSAASADEVRAARRNLAKQHHPDTGGDVDRMLEINHAVSLALAEIESRRLATQLDSTGADATQRSPEPGGQGGFVRDVPSFTVEALPVETFEALLVVATWIGELVDDDPPYRLDTRLVEPGRCWCTLELVPDAGASTVSISIAPEDDHPLPMIAVVRDTWVDQLNRYDWDSDSN